MKWIISQSLQSQGSPGGHDSCFIIVPAESIVSVMNHALRDSDFRDIYQMLGECHELWADPQAWQSHLLAGLSRIIDLPGGLITEISGIRPGGERQIRYSTENNFGNPLLRREFEDWLTDTLKFLALPTLPNNWPHPASPGDTRIPVEIRWNGNYHSKRAPRHSIADVIVYSAGLLDAAEARYLILAFTGAGQRPTLRDRELISLVQTELGRLVGTRLALPSQISLFGLSLRRRQVIEHLLDGHAEKTIADLMNLRRSTVNEYLQYIYTHFGVQTRAELMAYLYRRRPLERETLSCGTRQRCIPHAPEPELRTGPKPSLAEPSRHRPVAVYHTP